MSEQLVSQSDTPSLDRLTLALVVSPAGNKDVLMPLPMRYSVRRNARAVGFHPRLATGPANKRP